MSKACKFVLNRKAVRELMHSDEMVQILQNEAGKLASSAGPGYAADVSNEESYTRAVARVYTEDFEAVRDNSDNNTLTRLISK